jgi:tRNA (guanine-N7-)-methyltransferase
LLEIERRALRNLWLYDGDAVELLRACPAAIFDAIYIFFPDPWPKSRHHKRRLLNAALLELVAARLKRHGRLFCATDDADYAQHMMTALAALATWENLAGTGKFAPRPRLRLLTRFEARARAAGRTVYEVIAAPLDCSAPA